MTEIQKQNIQFHDLRKYISEDVSFSGCTINYKDRDGIAFSKKGFADDANILACKSNWIFENCAFISSIGSTFFVDLSEQKSPTYNKCSFFGVSFANSVSRVSRSKFFTVPNKVMDLDFSQLSRKEPKHIDDLFKNITKFIGKPTNSSPEIWIYSESDANNISDILRALRGTETPCKVNFCMDDIDTEKVQAQRISVYTSADKGSNLFAETKNFIVSKHIGLFSEIHADSLIFRENFVMPYDTETKFYVKKIRVENSSSVKIPDEFAADFKNVRWDVEEGSSVTFGDQLITSSGSSSELLNNKAYTEGVHTENFNNSTTLEYYWNLFKDEDKKDWNDILNAMKKYGMVGNNVAENMFLKVYNDYFIKPYKEAVKQNKINDLPDADTYWRKAISKADLKAMDVISNNLKIVSFKEFTSK